MRKRSGSARRPRWDAKGVIAALQEWVALEGPAPSSDARLVGRQARGRWAREYPRWPSTAVVSSRFGAWNAALVAVGLLAKPSAYSDGEVIEALRG